jgi:hypothetical protein
MVAVWHQSKAKVNRLLGKPQETYTTHESTCCVPYEIVEMITAHLTRDLDTLKACSLTCRSWYILAVPHLHHTLSLRSDEPNFIGRTDPPSARDKLKPLLKLYNLGLMPLVKELRIEQSGTRPWCVPEVFSLGDWRYFSAFANVHTLEFRYIQIHRFIPGIERYFGQFSPTLRSITLYRPCCTPRQLSHFLSLFSNLDKIEIRWIITNVPDTELVPFSAPKLRGLLTLYEFYWVETWTGLITSCDGLRFRHMHLRGSANCVPVLLGHVPTP